MKTKRNLSGIYFRSFDDVSQKWCNVVFEDLSKEEQVKIMDGRSAEWAKNLAVQLADTINNISEKFDILSE